MWNSVEEGMEKSTKPSDPMLGEEKVFEQSCILPHLSVCLHHRLTDSKPVEGTPLMVGKEYCIGVV
jgi:hypothetical protein